MRPRRSLAIAASIAAVLGLTQLATAQASSPTDADAKPTAAGFNKNIDRSLGNGLGRLVAEEASGQARVANGLASAQSSLAIRDHQGRVLIDLTPQADANRRVYRKHAEALGLKVTATDKNLGTLEGFAPLSAMQSLAALDQTGTIVQELRPVTHAGSTTSQGVNFQRVKQVLGQGIRGQGMTVGVLSDSYDDAKFDVFGKKLKIHASDDIASGDLPGPGNPQNSKPVVVIQDNNTPNTDTDEGRAMLQIVHDMAPKAKLCFATAFRGDVGFADNIRALADQSGPCGADVVVDDVGYFDEPFFSDGPIGDAVDDVEADGVAYFSSAGNSGDHQAWEAPVRLVNKKTGLKGTNLDFNGVDPALYAGGLEDMKAGPGTDIAQDYSVGAGGGLYDLQWDDPVDRDGALLGAPYFDTTGDVTTVDPKPSFNFTPTPGQQGSEVLFTVDGIPSGSTDLILTVKRPDGTKLGPVDTGSSPEKIATTLDQAGTWKITVSGYDGDTGDFTLKVEPVLAPSTVTTDFNVLVFAPNGAFLAALGDDNTLTGRPSEIFGLPEFPTLQFVIARATTGAVQVHHLRAILSDDMYVSEYFDPTAPATFGHPTAAGAIAVGAYDPFKSYLPEPFTSPGGQLKFYYDSDGNPYPQPQVRAKPEVSGTDVGNTTFFVSDTARDNDTFPNFGGTSAAAPHNAAIAALMLQHAGGPGSLTPDEIRNRMEHSTFAHDLNPSEAAGSSDGLAITASGSQSDERNATPGSLADPNFFNVSYAGKSSIEKITFYGETASPTSLKGLVFDPRKLAKPGLYEEGGFPFTVGRHDGVKKGSIHASFSERFAALPKGVYQQMTLNFKKGLDKGESFGFGIDRDAALWAKTLPAIEGNGADELGGAVSIPSDEKLTKGMRFRAVLTNGDVITGRFMNQLGHGWTPVDGYGLVNAEKAVLGVH